MAYLNGNMNIMRFVTRENEAPRYKGIFPLKVDSVGGAVSEWYLYGNIQGVGERTENLLDVSKIQEGTSLNGGTVERNGTAIIIHTSNQSNNTPDAKPSTLNDLTNGLLEIGKSYKLYITSTDKQRQYIYLQGANVAWNNRQVLEITQERLNSQVRWYAPSTSSTATISDMMICKASETIDHYIPYGYQIPLDIRSLSDTNEITINGESATVNGITYTVDKEAGTITANGTAEKNSAFMIYIYGLMGDFMFSGTPEDGSIDTYFSLIVDTMGMPCNKWDGTPLTENDYDYGVGMHEVRLDTPQANYMILIKAGYTCDNLVFKPTLIRADVTDTTNIYVGSSPLGEGEMVSRESTNLDITLERGQSVFETTLTNKPEMIVTPDSYDKIKDMLLNTKQYDYNETQSDTITDEVTEVTQ